MRVYESSAISSPLQPVRQNGGSGPLSTGRPLWQLYRYYGFVVGHKHGKCQLLAVGRPRQSGGRAIEMGKLRELSRCKNNDEYLCRSVPVRQEGNLFTVRGPNGRRIAPVPVRELPDGDPFRINDPNVADRAVLCFVNPGRVKILGTAGMARRGSRARGSPRGCCPQKRMRRPNSICRGLPA
jgi:hypothetical protein